jgi:hypothetical protein
MFSWSALLSWSSKTCLLQQLIFTAELYDPPLLEVGQGEGFEEPVHLQTRQGVCLVVGYFFEDV